MGLDQGRAIGVHGISEAGVAVQGDGGDTGVSGSGLSAGVSGDSPEGNGVLGTAGTGTSSIRPNLPAGVVGVGTRKAVGVVGFSAAKTSSLGAIVGLATASTGGLAGVLAYSIGFGPGLSARSEKGRGVVAQSPVAQLRLVPDTGKTHPARGLRGDLYVDLSTRLWFCTQGGPHSKWRRLA
jgi:hypothetical protein